MKAIKTISALVLVASFVIIVGIAGGVEGGTIALWQAGFWSTIIFLVDAYAFRFVRED